MNQDSQGFAGEGGGNLSQGSWQGLKEEPTLWWWWWWCHRAHWEHSRATQNGLQTIKMNHNCIANSPNDSHTQHAATEEGRVHQAREGPIKPVSYGLCASYILSNKKLHIRYIYIYIYIYSTIIITLLNNVRYAASRVDIFHQARYPQGRWVSERVGE